MELTDKVILLKSVIDGSTGNKYQARREPYQYGELPLHVRDNPNFVKPANQVKIIPTVVKPQSPLAKENEIRLDAQPQEDVIEIKPQQINVKVEEIQPEEENITAPEKPADIIPTEKKIEPANTASSKKEGTTKKPSATRKVKSQPPSKN